MDPCFESAEVTFKFIKEALDGVNDPGTARKIAQSLRENFHHKRRMVKLQRVAEARIKSYLDQFEGKRKAKALNDLISGSGVRQDARIVSLERRADAVLSIAHSKLNKAYEAYQPKMLGFAHSKQAQRNMILEVFGTKTGDQDAMQYARLWSDVAEYLRTRFNRAGGNIEKLETWNVPVHHDPVRVNKVSREQWVDETDLLLDHSKMLHYKGDGTTVVMTDAERRNLLGQIYEAIRSDGIRSIDPKTVNKYARPIIGQFHQEHRLLHFKNGESWMKYNDKYGSTNYFDSLDSHLEMMSKEVAAMEMLGPAADTTLAKARKEVQKATGLRSSGQLAENAYIGMMGRLRSQNHSISNMMNAMRAFQTGMKIGGAPIAAIGDIAYNILTSAYNGVPAVKSVFRMMRNLNPMTNKADRQLAARLGLLAEYAVDRAKTANRYGMVSGYGAAARFADATVRASGLNHWTHAGRQAFGLEFLSNLGNMAERSWNQVKPRTRRAFERYGITPEDWAKIGRATTVDRGVTYVDPMKLVDGTPEGDDLVAKVVGMVREEMQFAIPEPNAKARAIANQGLPSGTAAGEMIRTMGQFKAFGISVISSHFARGLNLSGAQRVAYLGSLVAGTTVFGTIAIQTREMLNGKEPIRPDDVSGWTGLAARGFAQGGATGIIGDMVFQDPDRMSGISSAIAGPLVGDIEQFGTRLIGGTAKDIISMEEDWQDRLMTTGAKAVERFTPGKLWYTNLALKRGVHDALNKWADPNWTTKQRRIRTRMRKDYNQRYWYKPTGEFQVPFTGE